MTIDGSVYDIINLTISNSSCDRKCQNTQTVNNKESFRNANEGVEGFTANFIESIGSLVDEILLLLSGSKTPNKSIVRLTNLPFQVF
jgi:hypothetical protein